MEARTDGERDLAQMVQARAATFARSLITHFDREFNVRARMAHAFARSNIAQGATGNAMRHAAACALCRCTSCTRRVVHPPRSGVDAQRQRRRCRDMHTRQCMTKGTCRDLRSMRDASCNLRRPSAHSPCLRATPLHAARRMPHAAPESRIAGLPDCRSVAPPAAGCVHTPAGGARHDSGQKRVKRVRGSICGAAFGRLEGLCNRFAVVRALHAIA